MLSFNNLRDIPPSLVELFNKPPCTHRTSELGCGTSLANVSHLSFGIRTLARGVNTLFKTNFNFKKSRHILAK
ncbi:hypothetical protein SLEP1_g27871 [Rubroshorea leprosula]|uniref:Uncharacterized protein n=1 Tax=Rubroshorea leprosula TaxID=152421 RepID=A0AAV5JY96_9ROSI|nr:hypothetical protein SLEP1_g27871 [Rubroshorea leprosula]